MCGIFGFVSNNLAGVKINEKKLFLSLNTLKHRGPDGVNTWTDYTCYLGFRHLSFFDKCVSLQPLHNENNTIHLVGNGEIFNYRKLRRQLAAKHVFKSESDCEVIIHLYEEFGDKFLRHIKGQFAFIIWDKKRRRIVAARDRFGICPLFYLVNNEGYVFASEIKALLENNINSVSLDMQGVVETLFFYGPVPPRTCFKNVFQIPPGFYLTVNVESRKLTLTQYWSLKFSPERNNSEKHPDHVLNELRLILQQAVKNRLHGDFVPGVYASGGLDSSVIATILSKYERRPTLFSLQFEDSKYDESYYQRILTNHLKLPQEALLITSGDIIGNLVRTIWHTECPLIRTAPIPMFLLSQLVRQKGYRCVVSGEGGDELLAGYPVFQKNMPSIVSKFSTAQRVLRLFKEKKKLFHHVEKMYKDLYKPEKTSAYYGLHYCQEIEVRTKLSQYLLNTQGDRVAMAHGIEQRFPFLDEDFVAFIESLPMQWFIAEQKGKFILRQAMKDKIPISIIERPKQGYLAPDRCLLDCYRTKKTFLNDLLSPEAIKSTGYFEAAEVDKLLSLCADFSSTADKYVNLAFVFLVTTQILHKLFIEKDLSLLSLSP